LALYPEARLLDAKTTELNVELKPFYDVERPHAEFRLHLQSLKAGTTAAELRAPIQALPQRFELPLTGELSGDYVLRYAIEGQSEPLAAGSMTISLVDRVDERLAALNGIDGDETLRPSGQP
jgi:hypothetical protein